MMKIFRPLPFDAKNRFPRGLVFRLEKSMTHLQDDLQSVVEKSAKDYVNMEQDFLKMAAEIKKKAGNQPTGKKSGSTVQIKGYPISQKSNCCSNTILFLYPC